MNIKIFTNVQFGQRVAPMDRAFVGQVNGVWNTLGSGGFSLYDPVGIYLGNGVVLAVMPTESMLETTRPG